MSGFELRPYEEGDEVEINRLFNEVFHCSRTIDEWFWKFRSSCVNPPILLGFLDGRLVTQYAGIPERLFWKGREVAAAQIVDVFSTRAARSFARRGAWVRTVDGFFEDFGASGRYPLLYGFPGKRALRLGVLQLGYDALSPQPILQMERKVKGYRGNLRRRLYKAELLRRDNIRRVDELWERARSEMGFGIIRDSLHLSRRFLNRPGMPYHLFGISPRFSDRLVAYVVFRQDGGCCRWVDFILLHGHPGAFELMSVLGWDLARQNGVDREEVWLHGDDEILQLLGTGGFQPNQKELPLAFVARSFGSDFNPELLEEGMYLTMGDTDLF